MDQDQGSRHRPELSASHLSAALQTSVGSQKLRLVKVRAGHDCADLIFGGLLIRGWIVMPFRPHLFQASQTAGRIVTAYLQERPRPLPLYVISASAEYNLLTYVRTPVRAVALDELARLDTAATAVLLPEELEALAQQNPKLHFVVGQELTSLKQPYRIVEVFP